MSQLLPQLRAALRRAGGIQDGATRKAVEGLEQWAVELVARLSAVDTAAVGGVVLPIAMSDVTGLTAALSAKVATTRSISTTSPLSGGGTLAADLTLAVADNSTSSKGVVSQAPNDTTKFWRGDATWAAVQVLSGAAFIYGDGQDGDIHFDGSTTITLATGTTIVPAANVYTLPEDVCGHDITVDSGVTVWCTNWQLCATGTLTNNGTIHNDGKSAVGASAGASTTGHKYAVNQAGAGGIASAGNGTSTANRSGIVPFWSVTSAATAGNNGGGHGQGGGGGSAGANTGGSSGTLTPTAAQNGRWIGHDGFVTGRTVGGTQLNTGTGGGGGAVVGAGAGAASGGGGAAGGICYVGAQRIAGSGLFSAKGGNGGNATLGSVTGCGGGGGGGGGILTLAYSTATGSWTTSVAGGTGGTGAGTGGNGGNGSSGVLFRINLSGDGT